jgi:ankyrin repeat protein
VGQLLDASGIDANAADQFYGRTPLWEAVSQGHEAVVRQLLASPGINVNAGNKEGRTPLWEAASRGHESVFCHTIKLYATLLYFLISI